LEQIQADECIKPKPVRAVVVGQQETGEDKQAGEATDDQVRFRKIPFFGFDWFKLVAVKISILAPLAAFSNWTIPNFMA